MPETFFKKFKKTTFSFFLKMPEILCPFCGQKTAAKIPENSCQYFWKCPKCGEILRPKKGDCCVFCSFSDQKCPTAKK